MVRETIHVLMIDDNPIDVEIVRTMVGQYPHARFEVHSVASTNDCREALELASYDLLLLDHNLPGEDGLSFLRRIRGRAEFPPVIMLTGDGDERLAVEALRSGASDYFPKRVLNSEILALAIHQALKKARLSEQLDSTEQVIFALAAAVEAKDSTTEGHLRRMAHYAGRVAEALRLDEEQSKTLTYGAFLHDIGKVGVSEAILVKPGSLTPAEWEEIRRHPEIGEKICAPLRFAKDVVPIIRHHHERWDGTGYVEQLSGEEIPFLARVISVVDAFDAMTSERPYRRAMPLEQALSRLSDGAGSQWDPYITRVFVDLAERETLGSSRDASRKAA